MSHMNLSCSRPGFYEFWMLRSSHTAISEVYDVAIVVDFANIPPIYFYIVLCVLSKGFSLGTGIYRASHNLR